MAQINNTKHSLQVDMTPMVDLGFLLITFFILTTIMTETKVMHLVVPKDGTETPMPEGNTLTLVLGKHKRYALTGAEHVTGFDVTGTALRETLIQYKKKLAENGKPLMVIIKPSPESDYQHLISVLDEMTINDIRKYTIGDPDENELKWIASN